MENHLLDLIHVDSPQSQKKICELGNYIPLTPVRNFLLMFKYKKKMNRFPRKLRRELRT
jgi:hypothetical protein